jgi:hypothetical protein
MFKQSIVKFDRKRKLDMLVGKIASKMATDANDPLAKKYLKLRKAYFGIKEKIMRKYGPRAKKAAMQIANSSNRKK